jgi:hypothetical protein
MLADIWGRIVNKISKQFMQYPYRVYRVATAKKKNKSRYDLNS